MNKSAQQGIFSKEAFCYDPDTDTFLCPANQRLKRIGYSKKHKQFEYKADGKICSACQLKDKCTRSKTGRTLRRHLRQEELDKMIKQANSSASKRDLKQRQQLSERSFAQSTRYGFKRARWRRLWRMQIQDYLIAAIQNITKLIKVRIPSVSKSNVKAATSARSISYFYNRLMIKILCSSFTHTQRLMPWVTGKSVSFISV